MFLAPPTTLHNTTSLALLEDRKTMMMNNNIYLNKAAMVEATDCPAILSFEDGGFATILPVNFEPSDFDVVLGRGKDCTNHPGNKRLREIVQTSLPEYASASSRSSKSRIILKVVEDVKRTSPSGSGFVKRDDNSGRWFEVGEFLSREKTSQAFRDALHDKYRSSRASKKVIRDGMKEQESSDETKDDKSKSKKKEKEPKTKKAKRRKVASDPDTLSSAVSHTLVANYGAVQDQVPNYPTAGDLSAMSAMNMSAMGMMGAANNNGFNTHNTNGMGMMMTMMNNNNGMGNYGGMMNHGMMMPATNAFGTYQPSHGMMMPQPQFSNDMNPNNLMTQRNAAMGNMNNYMGYNTNTAMGMGMGHNCNNNNNNNMMGMMGSYGNAAVNQQQAMACGSNPMVGNLQQHQQQGAGEAYVEHDPLPM